MNPADPARHFLPLDGLRGLAVTVVVVAHAGRVGGPGGGAISAVTRSGWVGVALFFVLSGFLITGILLDAKGRPGYLRNFYARRALRIFPLYYLYLAAYFYVAPRLTAALPVVTDPTERLFFWLYAANYRGLLPRPTAGEPLDPLWSLGVEEQVYLVWPLLVAALPVRRLAAALAGLVPAALGWRAVTLAAHAPTDCTAGWTPANLDGFALGGLVAVAVRVPGWGDHLSRWAPRAAAGGGLFVLGMAAGQRHFVRAENPVPMLTVGVTACVVGFAGLIGWLVTAPPTAAHRVLACRWLAGPVRYSYAMYVLHGAVILLLLPAFGRPDPEPWQWSLPAGPAAGFTAAVWLVTLAVAWVSWHAFEKWFLKLKRLFPTPHREVGAAADPALRGRPT